MHIQKSLPVFFFFFQKIQKLDNKDHALRLVSPYHSNVQDQHDLPTSSIKKQTNKNTIFENRQGTPEKIQGGPSNSNLNRSASRKSQRSNRSNKEGQTADVEAQNLALEKMLNFQRHHEVSKTKFNKHQYLNIRDSLSKINPGADAKTVELMNLRELMQNKKNHLENKLKELKMAKGRVIERNIQLM